MTYAEIIRAAIPSAPIDLCEHILWNRTSFPMGKVSAKGLFKAASGFERANKNGMVLCDLCSRPAKNGFVCDVCDERLRRSSWTKE